MSVGADGEKDSFVVVISAKFDVSPQIHQVRHRPPRQREARTRWFRQANAHTEYFFCLLLRFFLCPLYLA